MREQSHKDEMSAAVRGDFERLRERRERARAPSPATRPERIVLTPPPRAQSVPGAAAKQADAPVELPSPSELRRPDVEEAPSPVASAEPPRRSFLRSLLGR